MRLATSFLALTAFFCASLGTAQALSTRWERLASEEKGFWTAKASFAQFAPAESPVVGRANSELEVAVAREFEAFVGRAFLARKADPKFFTGPWGLEIKNTVSVATAELVSAYVEASIFEGGAHPNLVLTCVTIGKRGEQVARLRFSDLVKPGLDARKLANTFLMARLKEKKASLVEDGIVEALSDEQIDRFVVTPTSLTFLFAPYSVGSYAEGTITVKIPFTDLADVLDPQGPLKGLLKR